MFGKISRVTTAMTNYRMSLQQADVTVSVPRARLAVCLAKWQIVTA